MSNETEWVLVPREPSEAMLSAAHYELADKPFSNNAERSERAYAAMLDAAPQPPAEAQPVACTHEAWEESAGWNRCVDCGHGWASASPPSAPVRVEDESVRVGNLPTMNQDGYPGLGEWWVQLWRGDEIIARVYGDGPDEVRSQAQDIADALNQQPAAVDEDDFDCPHSAFDNCDCYADQQGGES